MPSTIVKSQVRLGRMPTVFSRKDGSVVGVNTKRQMETPFFLQSNPPSNKVSFGALATSVTQAMRVSGQGPMQICELGAVRTGACTVMIYINDGNTPMRLMNNPCHIDTIFGQGGNMYGLPEALYLDETRSLSIAYTDLANSGNNAVQAAFSASKYGNVVDDPTLARIKQRLKNNEYMSMPMWLTFDQGSVTLASLANGNYTMQVPNNFNFEVHQISFVSTGTFSYNVTQLESGESLINAPSNTSYAVPNLLQCGTNKYPYRLSEPWLIFGGQTLQFFLCDTSAASNTIWITICGKMVTQRQWS